MVYIYIVLVLSSYHLNIVLTEFVIFLYIIYIFCNPSMNVHGGYDGLVVVTLMSPLPQTLHRSHVDSLFIIPHQTAFTCDKGDHWQARCTQSDIDSSQIDNLI